MGQIRAVFNIMYEDPEQEFGVYNLVDPDTGLDAITVVKFNKDFATNPDDDYPFNYAPFFVAVDLNKDGIINQANASFDLTDDGEIDQIDHQQAMAEGQAILDAYNAGEFNDEDDDDDDDDNPPVDPPEDPPGTVVITTPDKSLPWWAILLIVIGGLGVVAAIVLIPLKVAGII